MSLVHSATKCICKSLRIRVSIERYYIKNTHIKYLNRFGAASFVESAHYCKMKHYGQHGRGQPTLTAWLQISEKSNRSNH